MIVTFLYGILFSAKATYAAIANTYSFLTPDLWKETVFQKSLALPGVHILPVQEPQAGGRPEAGTEALLGTLLPYFLAVRFI
jgi:hypothetical protein